MAYNKSSGTYDFGKNYSRDGSDWNSSAPTPRLSRAYESLVKSGATEFIMTFTGKLYKGRSTISGASYIVDLDSLKEILAPIVPGKKGGKLFKTEQKVQQLFRLTDEPQKITFMSFFPFN